MKFNDKIVISNYFIFLYETNESEYYLLAMNWNHIYNWYLIYATIIFYFIPTFIKFIQIKIRKEKNEISILIPYSWAPNTPYIFYHKFITPSYFGKMTQLTSKTRNFFKPINSTTVVEQPCGKCEWFSFFPFCFSRN